ncbi:hypothetical protein ACJMK2_028398 [Sinanodonta woodiana]|uniref:Uncharacterized protein n=1 Tax=Sinanodonta woodiana TaxID=1069815 RepID=A0ABD3X6Z6_SINWO
MAQQKKRKEMEVHPLLQKVIAVYHITQVLAIITCVVLSINYMSFYALLSAIFPIIVFIIFWVASKCNFQDLVVILVHYNPILSTMWFLSVFPGFVMACVFTQDLDIYSTSYVETVNVRETIVAVLTGILSLSSAIFAVMGIWKSARKVVLIAKSTECDPVNTVGSVPSSYEAPVTFTDLNGIQLAQGCNGQPMLPR